MQAARYATTLMAMTQLASAIKVEGTLMQDDDNASSYANDGVMPENRCDQDNSACLMFGPDGWDDQNEDGITYYEGFMSGLEYGQKDCDDGKHYHNYGPPD